jgi:hypothetical protein
MAFTCLLFVIKFPYFSLLLKPHNCNSFIKQHFTFIWDMFSSIRIAHKALQWASHVPCENGAYDQTFCKMIIEESYLGDE